MLSVREQRILRQIEDALRADDRGFSAGSRCAWAYCGAVRRFGAEG